MKVLYVATDVDVDGRHGGAVHVREVAAELARRGHRVRVVARRAFADGEAAGYGVRGALSRLPRMLRLLSLPVVVAEVRRFRPDVILERYYNFGGEGVVSGLRHGTPAILEVNSPMIEYAGSPKERIDRWLGQPMRRWREWMAGRAAAFVTPTAAILPPGVPP
ncbi:MAG: glycosyltransferase family 4 protein, partial [Candidatus Binatia bacterium]